MQMLTSILASWMSTISLLMYFKWIWITPWMKLQFPLANWETEQMQGYLKQREPTEELKNLDQIPAIPALLLKNLFPLFIGVWISHPSVDIHQHHECHPFWGVHTLIYFELPNCVHERMQNDKMNKIWIEVVQRTAQKLIQSHSFRKETFFCNHFRSSKTLCLRLSALNFVTLSPRVSLHRGDRVGSNEGSKLKSWERAIDPYTRHLCCWLGIKSVDALLYTWRVQML